MNSNYSLIVPTIFIFSIASSLIQAQAFTKEEKECLADMIILHPKKGQIVVEGGVFALANKELPKINEIKEWMKIDIRFKQLKECLKKWQKELSKEYIMAMYEEMSNSQEKAFPISPEVHGQIHNAQCFIQLMVLEGKTKMGSPEIAKPTPIHDDWISALISSSWENIQVSKSGKAYLEECILKEEKWKIIVDRENYMHISGHGYGYHSQSWKKVPYSVEFIKEIDEELHCLAKLLVEYFAVFSNLSILQILSASQRERNGGKEYKLFRSIGLKDARLKKIYKNGNEALFGRLNKCTKRKAAFLKSDGYGDYVDISAILSQGFVIVDNAFKEKLDKQSDCLMEYFNVKYGIEVFQKVVGFNALDIMINNAYHEYIFNKGTTDAFLLKLDMSHTKIIEALQKTEEHLIVKGTEAYNSLEECGVKISLHLDDQIVFDLHRLLGVYNQNQLFLRKIKTDDFMKTEIYSEPIKNVATGGDGSSAAGADAGQKKGDDNNGSEDGVCPTCLMHFLNGDRIHRYNCNHIIHAECNNGWIDAMHTTCQICRSDSLKKKITKVVQSLPNIFTQLN